MNRPFKAGLLLKGAYTLSKAENEADDDGWVGLTFNTPSQLDRNFALAGYDRTHNLPDGVRLPAALAGDVRLQQPLQGHRGRLAVERRLRGVQRPAVPRHGQRCRRRHAGQPADGGSRRRRQPRRRALAPAGLTTIRQRGRSHRACDSATPGATPFRGPGGVNLDLGVFRSFPLGATRRIEVRVQAANVTNTPKFGQPNNDVTSGSFMRITGDTSDQQFGTYGPRADPAGRALRVLTRPRTASRDSETTETREPGRHDACRAFRLYVGGRALARPTARIC